MDIPQQYSGQERIEMTAFTIFFILFVVTALVLGKYTRFHLPDNDSDLKHEDESS